jgi:hypothetical protein
MTDDTAFERDVRAMLAARDPGPAPTHLEVVVRGRLMESPRRSRRGPAIGWALGVAALAILAVVVLRARGAIGLLPIDPGTGAATPTTFDPTATGSGLVDRPSDVFPVWFIVAAAIVVGGYAAVRIRRRWPRLGAIGLAAAVGLGAYGLGTAPFVEWRTGAYKFGQGWEETTSPQDGTFVEPPERDQATFAVGPGGILTYGFDVTNSAKVPITILGVAPDAGARAWGVVNAVGLLDDSDMFDISQPDHTHRFSPIQVEPDQRVFLIVAGRAAACALPPGSPPDPNGGGASFASVDVVYEILGLRRVTAVDLPFVGDVRMDSACMSRP